MQGLQVPSSSPKYAWWFFVAETTLALLSDTVEDAGFLAVRYVFPQCFLCIA